MAELHGVDYWVLAVLICWAGWLAAALIKTYRDD